MHDVSEKAKRDLLREYRDEGRDAVVTVLLIPAVNFGFFAMAAARNSMHQIVDVLPALLCPWVGINGLLALGVIRNYMAAELRANARTGGMSGMLSSRAFHAGLLRRLGACALAGVLLLLGLGMATGNWWAAAGIAVPAGVTIPVVVEVAWETVRGRERDPRESSGEF